MKENLTLKETYGIHFIFFFVIAAFALWLRSDIFIEYAGGYYKINYSAIDERLLPENEGIYYETDHVNIPLVVYKYVYGNFGYITAISLSFLTGLASIALFYLFSLELLNNKSAAFLTAFALYLQSPHIILSKSLSPEIMNFLILTISLYLGVIALNKKEKYNYYLIAAVLLFLIAAVGKLTLIFIMPIFILIFFLNDRKKGAISLAVSLIALGGHFLYYEYEFSRLAAYLSYQVKEDDFRAVMLGAGKAVFLPLIMFVSVYTYRFRLGISGNFLTSLLVLSVPFLCLSMIGGWRAFQGNVIYSVVFLVPGAGLLLKQFSFMDRDFRNAAMILLVSMAILAFYIL